MRQVEWALWVGILVLSSLVMRSARPNIEQAHASFVYILIVLGAAASGEQWLGILMAVLGFLADMVPSSVARAAGRMGGGTSLDNSMRFGPAPDTEWVLIDYDPYLAHHGYAHGGARVWSEDGVLLGIASQTASVILIGKA